MTFRDPESAKKACVDPTPIIDGRRANCNLASLGRPRPPLPFGKILINHLFSVTKASCFQLLTNNNTISFFKATLFVSRASLVHV